jgi:D-glycero-alpha-D-manno-heptose 1-phosphate guanylyltransferase
METWRWNDGGRGPEYFWCTASARSVPGTGLGTEMNCGCALRGVQVVILCGGQGTRLRGVLPAVPKALAPTAGRPFLDYLLQFLVSAGITEVVLCIGVLGEAILEYCRSRKLDGLTLTVSREREPLGTAGALKHAEPFIHTDPFLMMNGDTFLELELAALLEQHRKSGATITMAMATVSDARRYGAVVTDARGWVTAFKEKEVGHSLTALATAPLDLGQKINAGCYAIQREVLKHIPVAPPAVSFETEVLPAFVQNGLHGYSTHGFFIDIGVPEDFARAQAAMCGRPPFGAANPS